MTNVGECLEKDICKVHVRCVGCIAFSHCDYNLTCPTGPTGPGHPVAVRMFDFSAYPERFVPLKSIFSHVKEDEWVDETDENAWWKGGLWLDIVPTGAPPKHQKNLIYRPVVRFLGPGQSYETCYKYEGGQMARNVHRVGWLRSCLLPDKLENLRYAEGIAYDEKHRDVHGLWHGRGFTATLGDQWLPPSHFEETGDTVVGSSKTWEAPEIT